VLNNSRQTLILPGSVAGLVRNLPSSFKRVLSLSLMRMSLGYHLKPTHAGNEGSTTIVERLQESANPSRFGHGPGAKPASGSYLSFQFSHEPDGTPGSYSPFEFSHRPATKSVWFIQACVSPGNGAVASSLVTVLATNLPCSLELGILQETALLLAAGNGHAEVTPKLQES
jgi:hypothetical protein